MGKNERTTRISIVLPDDMLEVIRAAAERERRPYSSLIREALENRFRVQDTVRLGGGRREYEDPNGNMVVLP